MITTLLRARCLKGKKYVSFRDLLVYNLRTKSSTLNLHLFVWSSYGLKMLKSSDGHVQHKDQHTNLLCIFELSFRGKVYYMMA